MKIIITLFLMFVSIASASDWKTVYPYVYDSEYYSIKSFDNNCFVIATFCSDNFDECGIRIYKSTNYGKHWNETYKSMLLTKQEYPPIADIVDSYSLDPNNHYFTTSLWSIMQKSSDGGKTFSRIPIDTNNYNYTLDNIVMFDTNYGFVSYNLGFFITKDGWKTYRKYTEHWYSSPFFIDSLTIGMIHTYILKGHDNKIGHYFVKYHINDNKFDTLSYFPRDSLNWIDLIEKIYFINDSLGFACGSREIYTNGVTQELDDIIYRTKDGGRHWELLLKEPKNPQFGLQDICFYDKKNGLAVGDLGKIWMTRDGGDTWVFDSLLDPVIQKIALRVAWAGRYPLITAWFGGIYRYEGNFFKIPPDTVLPQILADDKYFENTDYRNAVGRTAEISIRNKSSLAYLEITSSSNLSSPAFTTIGLPKIDSINTIVIPPDSSFKFKVRFKPTAIGLFADSIIFHSNAAGTDSLVYLIGEGVDSTISVNDGNKNNLFSVIPNPSSDYIQISYINHGVYPVVKELKIYNSIGELVLSKGIQNPESQRIDISSPPPGLYFVRYGSEYAKFIKE